MTAADPLELIGEAINALGRGDAAMARSALASAVQLDSSLARVADAFSVATEQLDRDEEISEGAWNVVADACPADLLGAVELARG